MKDIAFEFNGFDELVQIYLIDKKQLKDNIEKQKSTPMTYIFRWKDFRKNASCFDREKSMISWFNAKSKKFYSEELNEEQKKNVFLGIFFEPK